MCPQRKRRRMAESPSDRQKRMENEKSRMGSRRGYDARPDSFLERGGCDRRSSDPYGIRCFLRRQADYLVTAVTAVLFSVLQTRIFIRGSAVETSFYWGFISEDKSMAGVVWFLLQMSGIFFVGVIPLLVLLKKRLHRALTVSCLFPLLFAFCFSLTPDVTVNHKYIMISYAFLTILWAEFLPEYGGNRKKTVRLPHSAENWRRFFLPSALPPLVFMILWSF